MVGELGVGVDLLVHGEEGGVELLLGGAREG